jgi:hypothetical protein
MGLYDGHDLVDSWRLSTERDRTADEYRLFFAGLLRQDGYRLEEVDGVALSSVVPTVKAAMIQVAEEMIGGPLVVIGPGVKTGMPINIDNPREVGADRVVNSVARRLVYGTPVVSVDFGTSTNLDAVDATGAYVGGAIARASRFRSTPSSRRPRPCAGSTSPRPAPPSAGTPSRRSRAGSSTGTPGWSTGWWTGSWPSWVVGFRSWPPGAWPLPSFPIAALWRSWMPTSPSTVCG